MSENNLGRLQKVDLRKAWGNEEADFTPWLTKEENLRLLGETLGMDLELEAQEKQVGPFRADILCKDALDGSWVLIENQLAKTDHTHLGQIMTYAAGLEAVTVIWIAGQFTNEHRAALDWLNEISGEKFSFFGLEVELWRIGDSPIAPKFNIVSKPNDWTKSGPTRRSGELTEQKRTQLEFWTAFKAYMEERSSIRCHKPAPQHWLNASIGRSGFHLSSIASFWDSVANKFDPEIRVELVMSDENSKQYFALLSQEREQIEREIGHDLTWHNPESARMTRIYVRKNSNFRDRSKWTEQFEWLRTNLEQFHKVFGARVAKLDATQ